MNTDTDTDERRADVINDLATHFGCTITDAEAWLIARAIRASDEAAGMVPMEATEIIIAAIVIVVVMFMVLQNGKRP